MVVEVAADVVMVAVRVRARRGGVAPGAGALGVLQDEPLQLPPDALHLVRVEERRRLLLCRCGSGLPGRCSCRLLHEED